MLRALALGSNQHSKPFQLRFRFRDPVESSIPRRIMRVYRNAWEEGESLPGSVVAIGNFDGVHLGQRTLLERVCERGRELNLPAVAVTFDPHPLRALDPARAPLRLTSSDQKEALLRECGLDALYEVFFTPKFAKIPARRFVREFLLERLAVREVYVGTAFAFGHRREGDLSLLTSMGRDFGFRAVGLDEVTLDGQIISSTRIRNALLQGNPEEATRLLGRSYELTGIIVRGAQRGRTLGFPTINLACEQELLPKNGVYVGEAELNDEVWRAVINVGRRPTVEIDGPRWVEAHLLDFDEDVYGVGARVRVCHRLRDEVRFDSLEELQRQIQIDVEHAREYISSAACSPK